MSDENRTSDGERTSLCYVEEALRADVEHLAVERVWDVDGKALAERIKVLPLHELHYAVNYDRALVEIDRRLAGLLPSAATSGIAEATNAADPDLATAPPTAPPRGGEALIVLFCKREMREAVLGDLDEKFAEMAERRGPRVAKAWYWGQAGRSVLFFAVRWGRRLLELEAILKRIL